MRPVLNIQPDDILTLRKPHPCGSLEWVVMRLGSDVRIQCLKCLRTLLLSRADLEQRVRIPKGPKVKP